VIPQNNPHSVTMATADLAGVVDRAGAILAHGRAICMRMSSDKALFSANNNGESNVTEDVDAEYAGPEIEIGFNYKYLGQLAAGIVGDKVSLALLDAASPAVITDPGDAATLYVLMPMRV
jgi:DNA polymerase-3 subunit beta